MSTDATGSTQFQANAQINAPATLACQAAQCIREDVQPRTAHVQIGIAVGTKNPEGGGVYHQATDCDNQHQSALDVRRATPALIRFDKDEDGDRHEGGAVDESGEDLSSMVPIRPLCGGWPAREAHGEQGERQRTGIREHVTGISDQRQRAREQPTDDLDGHVKEHERQRDR